MKKTDQFQENRNDTIRHDTVRNGNIRNSSSGNDRTGNDSSRNGNSNRQNYGDGVYMNTKSNIYQKRKPASRMPLLLLSLVVILLILALVFFLSKCKSNPPVVSSSDSTSGYSASASVQSADPVSSADASSAAVGEDTIVGKFFGGLYTAKNPKTVVHNDVRALYIGAAANLDKNIEIANNSAINAFVVDLKESNGVYFQATNKLANEIGAVKVMYNIETLIAKCKKNNIKLIGRIVCFKDYVLSEKRPDLCIKDEAGNLLKYPMEGSKVFVNAYSKEVWQYNIDIAKEAIALGFDEIQFDYVRFPICNPTIRAAEYFGVKGTVPTKIEAINRYLLTAKAQIQDELGIPLSADIFGIVLTSKLDGQLTGQEWETVGHLGVDTLSPMIYPSHYAKNTVMGGITFASPSADTYKFLNAVFKQEKFSETEGFSHVRCYIQAYDYTQAQIFGQIQALNENGFTEYIYWNPKGSYDLANMKQ